MFGAIWYAAMGNAAIGQRHEQSHLSGAALEAALTADDAEDPLGTGADDDGTTAGVAVSSNAPAVTTS